MLDQTLLMQTLKDIADTGERLSNQSEENAFVVIAEAFKNVGAAVEIERVPLFVSTVDSVCLKADGQRIDALGNAMTLPVMVETYAVLALLISILSIFGIGGLQV